MTTQDETGPTVIGADDMRDHMERTGDHKCLRYVAAKAHRRVSPCCEDEARRYLAANPAPAGLRPHDHAVSGCEYPCSIVAGTTEPIP